MAAYEESITKLKQSDGWWRFTDSQRVFLDGMCAGMTPIEAVRKAYPNTKNALALTKTVISTVGIQKALESIGIDVALPRVTKDDALNMLSKDLWKANDPELRIKLLNLYAKIDGWNKDEEEEKPEVNLDELVAAMEKKRKGKS